MIKNIRNSLDPKDFPRQTAKGIIQYTLLLNYQRPEIGPDDKNYISQIVDATDLCCFPLMNQSSYMVEYDFFGSNIKYSPYSFLFLNRYPNALEIPDLPRDISFSKLLVQNSIMSAYHALLTEYLNNCTTTSYQIVNRLKGAGAHKAMSTIKNGSSCVLIKEDKTECLSLPKHGVTSKQNSSEAATFGKQYANRLDVFPSLFSFVASRSETTSSNTSFAYKLQYAAFTKRIVDVKQSHLSCILNCKKDKNPAENIAESLSQLIKHFTPAFVASPLKATSILKSEGNDIVDEVYEYYLSEKVFSFNLFHNTLKIIQESENQHNNRYNFKHSESLKIIAKCKQLPCPFIAPYLLQFAFDHISDDTNSYHDYWSRHSLNSRDVFASRIKKPSGFHYGQWLHQFELYIDYLSSYVIPVYDWCFLSMLLEGIEKNHPNDSHLQHLELAITLLGNYIETNAKNIIFPLEIESREFFPTDFPTEWVDQLRRLFYNEHSVNLNIKPLTIEMFSSRRNVNGVSVANDNLSSIRDLYIESIINPY